MTGPICHGSILGGLVTTPDLAAALDDYQGRLGLQLVDQGHLDGKLAKSWDCAASAGAAMAVLQPVSGASCFIRLVEQPVPDAFVPTTSFGWASYEISCQNVFDWPAKIAGSGFQLIGEPKEIPGLPYFVAMQVHGRGKEMLYFNEVRMDTPTSDLPRAASPMDHIFIIILAAKDRQASVDWYHNQLHLDVGDSYTIEYSMINRAFDLPAGTKSSLTMVQAGRMPIFEVDEYPAQTVERPCAPNRLPPGNALVSIGVDSLDAIAIDTLAPPALHSGPLYAGRRAVTARGPSGELLELIEVG